MTAIGEKGRLAPGESWLRAMRKVHDLHAKGAKRRYRVRGRLLEPGWWAYEAVKTTPAGAKATAGDLARSPAPMTRAQAHALSAALPRCAQRARGDHGGDSKVAWPSSGLAYRAAEALGGAPYQCQLPAPAIGKHWHLTSSKRKGGRKR